MSTRSAGIPEVADPAPLSVVVDDDTETVRVDPTTGTVERDQPDGSVLVQLDAKRPSVAKDGEDEFYRNLVDDIDPMRLGLIANDLMDAINADDRSRSEYLAILARGLDLLGTSLEEPKATVGDSSAAVDGMSTVTNPLLLEALLKGWANAQAELLPASGPVKISNDGEETAAEDEMAEALERDFNHYLTKTAPEYYPDTSHMLLWGTYFGGSGFKKVYRCPLRRRPVSDSVPAKNLIVSDTTKDLRACERITHEIPMRPSVMKRMQMLGAYRRVGLTQPNPQPNQVDTAIAGIQGTLPGPDRPEDQPYTIWETQCELDLPEFAPKEFEGEGIPLPYLVTLDKDSREILAIRRDWKDDDENAERRRMYVKYPYVPGPGFYGTGLLNILGNSSAALTAAWREALDAGMFASFPAGLMAKLGARQNTSDYKLAPGTFQPIETNGLPIQQAVMGLPYRDVTPGLMSLIDKITAQAKEVGGAPDIPTGEGMQNVPVGTMLAMIEQATKIVSAAHKGMHQAQGEEFDLLIDLFRDDPEAFWRSNKEHKGYWNEELLRKALDNCRLVPVSDPNIPSHIHRLMKATALVQISTHAVIGPRLDGDEITRRVLAALREDPRGLQIQAPAQTGPAGDPAKLIKAQADLKNADTKAAEAGIKAQTVGTDAHVQLAKAQSEERVAGLHLQSEQVIHASDARKDMLDHSIAAGEQQLKVVKTAHDIARDRSETALGQAGHAEDATQAAHDRMMAERAHGLAVHQAINQPKKPKA
jgi:hypothetical protein